MLYLTARELIPDQPKYLGDKAQDAMFYGIFQDIWKVPGAMEWLRDSEKEVKMKRCFAVGCRMVEEKVGEFKMCKGCEQAWYCGPACQTRDWKVGMHRKVCKEVQGKAALFRTLVGR